MAASFFGDGLDYFPFHVISGKGIQQIEGEFGLKGFSIIVKLLQSVYSQGYYMPWNRNRKDLFSAQARVSPDLVSEVVSAALKQKEFDVLSQAGLCPEDMDKAMLAALAVFEKAKEGDVSAFREIQDLIGEKKAEKIDAEITVHLEGDVKDYAG